MHRVREVLNTLPQTVGTSAKMTTPQIAGRLSLKLLLPGNRNNIRLRQPKEGPSERLDDVIVLLSTTVALG